MMARERGVFQMIWKSFISSLKPQFGRRKLIGEDYYGTKYYEEQARQSSQKRPSRSFVPINKDDFTQELPAEWESWLRYRRQEPPTPEEIETNYQLALIKKKNAAALEEKYPKNAAIKESSPLSTQSVTSGNFPIYEDYKDHGRDYKMK